MQRLEQELTTAEARECQRVVALENKIESLTLSLATAREAGLQSVGNHHSESAKQILERERHATQQALDELAAEQRRKRSGGSEQRAQR